MIFLARYWRPLAGIAILAVVFLLGAHWQGNRDDRRAAIIAAEQSRRDLAAADALAEADAKALQAEHDAQDLNRRITDVLQPALTASTAAGANTARLLARALASRTGVCPVPAATDQPGTAQASGVASDAVEAATGAHLAACTRDAARLTALQDVVKGQM